MSDQLSSHAFHPATDPTQFKKALSRYTTGVAVVTAATPAGPIGITANSFTSISLSPALVMWAPAKTSMRHDEFVAANAFAIHILSSGQKDICDGFVRSKSAFDTVPFTLNEDGVPIISNSLAVFECKQYQTHDAGDHTIILGEVHTGYEQAGDSLVFTNGTFVSLPAKATL